MTTETPDRRAVPPTLEAVAAAAGVSRSTVSRVVNGSPQVSPDVVASVNAAIERLHYRPNRAATVARAPQDDGDRAGRARGHHAVLRRPVLRRGRRGASPTGSRTASTCSTSSSRARARPPRRPSATCSAATSTVRSSSRTTPATTSSRPWMPRCRSCSAAGRSAPRSTPTTTSTSTTRPAPRWERNTSWMPDASAIAIIAGPPNMQAAIDRTDGWVRAMRGAGLSTDLLEHGDFTQASGAAAMRALLERAPDLDAVFVASDLMAIGAVDVLREHGRRVPEDVAVVGFDDSAAATIRRRAAHDRAPAVVRDGRRDGANAARPARRRRRLARRPPADHADPHGRARQRLAPAAVRPTRRCVRLSLTRDHRSAERPDAEPLRAAGRW